MKQMWIQRLTGIIMMLTLFGGLAHAGTLTAGAGRADISIPANLYPLDDFVGAHDPLAVRVVLLDDGAKRVAIVVVDQTSLAATSIAEMKAILNRVASVQPDNAIVCASHTFSAPHVLAHHTPADANEQTAALERAIEASVQAAATQAFSSLRPARLGFGTGTSRVAVNRDVLTPGGWWLGANDSGYSDPSLGVLRIDGLDGKPLALLTNLAVQSSIMDGSVSEKGGKLITGDLAGEAMRRIEGHYGGDVVSAFLTGAAGDQAPYLQANRHVVESDGGVLRTDIHDVGFALVDLLGERLGQEAIEVADGISASRPYFLDVQRKAFDVTTQVSSPKKAPTGPVASFAYQPGAKAAVPVVIMRIGNIVLVGLQAELSASTGAQIKANSPFPHTLVVTMVDGAAKYMPDAVSYDRFSYEARNSGFARGSAEILASSVIGFLEQMHAGSVPR